MKQPTDYLCAPTALLYLLKKQGYYTEKAEIHAQYIRHVGSVLKSTPDKGTPAIEIVKYLSIQGVAFEIEDYLRSNMLIAHSPGGEPHYEVIVSHSDETQSVEVWDPETDTITTRTVESIEYSWHTPLSGERLGIHILPKEKGGG